MKLIGTPTYAADAVEYLSRKGFKHLYGVVDTDPNSAFHQQVVKLGSIQTTMAFHMSKPQTTQLCRYDDLVELAKAQHAATMKKNDEQQVKATATTETRQTVRQASIEEMRAMIVNELSRAFEEAARALVKATQQAVENKDRPRPTAH